MWIIEVFTWFLGAFQFTLVAQSCPNSLTPGTAAHQASLSITHLPEPALTHVYRAGDVIQWSRPLLSPSPPAFNLSQHQGLFQWVSSWHQWSKYLSFSFSISPSNEYSGLISFRIDWLDLLAVQGALNGLPQNQVQKHQFFSSQLSLQSNSHIHIWLLEKPKFWLDGRLLVK